MISSSFMSIACISFGCLLGELAPGLAGRSDHGRRYSGQLLSSIRGSIASLVGTSARLLALLSLLQARRHWSGAELAERLEVGARTVRRDVERLRGLGYPIEAAPGVAGGYRLGAGSELPPLLLDEEEAVAVAVGLRTAASVGVSGIEETSVRALAKLQQVLPSQLRRRVSALGWATEPYPGRGPAVDPELLATIAAALPRPRGPALPLPRATTARARGAPCSRTGSSTPAGAGTWSPGTSAARTGARSASTASALPSLADRRFAEREPPAADIVAYVARGVSSVRDRHRARVLLHAPLQEVSPRVPTAFGTLEAAGRDRCVLHAGADWLGGLAIYIAGIGVDFEVLDPPELRETVRELGARFTRAGAAPAARR